MGPGAGGGSIKPEHTTVSCLGSAPKSSINPHNTCIILVTSLSPSALGGGGWHEAMVLVCLPLAAHIGLSPLHIPTPCGSKRVLVVSPCVTFRRQQEGPNDPPLGTPGTDRPTHLPPLPPKAGVEGLDPTVPKHNDNVAYP